MFGGDARQLSIRSCFPRAWNNEQRYSCVLAGSAFDILRQSRQRSWMCLDSFDSLLMKVAAYGGRLYSFRGGVSSFVDSTIDQLKDPDIGQLQAELALQINGKPLPPDATEAEALVQLKEATEALEVLLVLDDIWDARSATSSPPPARSSPASPLLALATEPYRPPGSLRR